MGVVRVGGFVFGCVLKFCRFVDCLFFKVVVRSLGGGEVNGGCCGRGC